MLLDKNLKGEWIFTAGPHEGRLLSEVVVTHPEYVEQCVEMQYGLTEEAYDWMVLVLKLREGDDE
jgi:hypothetical protein